MDDVDVGWLLRSRKAVEERLGGAHRAPWHRGWWVTARSDYGQGEPPRGFEIRQIDLLGASRRIAEAPGRGRPVVILPGLYASLEERLFVNIAEGIARASGRPVVLLEDRLAPATLAATGGNVASIRRLGHEAATLAGSLPCRPDVLALSFGAAVALAAGQVWHLAVAWSSTPDVAAAAERLARSPLARCHYERTHHRAYATAGLAAPAPAIVHERLISEGARWRAAHPVPTLFVHAADDPVAPVSSVLAAATGESACAVVVPAGGHLGFGAIAGTGVYWLPLAIEREEARAPA